MHDLVLWYYFVQPYHVKVAGFFATRKLKFGISTMSQTKTSENFLTTTYGQLVEGLLYPSDMTKRNTFSQPDITPLYESIS